MARLAHDSSTTIHAGTEALKAVADQVVAERKMRRSRQPGDKNYVPDLSSFDGKPAPKKRASQAKAQRAARHNAPPM